MPAFHHALYLLCPCLSAPLGALYTMQHVTCAVAVSYTTCGNRLVAVQSPDTLQCLAQVISMDPLTRRSRFILCVAVGLGLGVTIVPNWATNNLWNVYPTTSSGLAGFRSG